MVIAAASAPSNIVNPLDDLLGYQLRRASAAILADLSRSLADLMLKPTEASVLLLIAHNPGVTQSEIGRVLGIKRANMAPIAALLTTRGLIDRTRPDGRSQRLWLSKAGVDTATEVRARITTHETRFLPGVSVSARAEIVALLRQIWMR